MKPDANYIQKHNFILMLVIYFRFLRRPIGKLIKLKKDFEKVRALIRKRAGQITGCCCKIHKQTGHS